MMNVRELKELLNRYKDDQVVTINTGEDVSENEIKAGYVLTSYVNGNQVVSIKSGSYDESPEKVNPLITLKINGYEEKNKIVEALINSGYTVGAYLEKDNLHRPKGWGVTIYER